MRLPWFTLLIVTAAHADDRPFAITVVDEDSGTPVPCVTIRTVDQIAFRSDEHGVIAFFEPGLLGQDVFFQSSGPPWEVPADGFGFHGRTLSTIPGGAASLPVVQTGTPTACEPGDAESRLVQDGLPPVADRHGIVVEDQETGRGIPMVELRSGARMWVTDSAGRAAIIEPDFLGATEEISASSHGYAPPPGPTTLDLTRGGRSVLRLRRLIPAERLYRVTGGGLYRDSILLGEPVPLAEPLLNAQVVGQDSVHTAVHQGRIHWIWGDTLRPSYPLGHFKTGGATSALPGAGGLDPAVGVDLAYFTDDAGFSRPVADVVPDGLVWTSGLVSLGDDLIASYANVGPGWTRLGAGMLRWDPAASSFSLLTPWPDPLPAEPTGTALVEGGFVYFTDIGDDGQGASPFRVVRVAADLESLADPSRYETFTTVNEDGLQVTDGLHPVWAWRRQAPPTPEALADPRNGLAGQLREAFGTAEVGDHIGSVFWNPWAGRYLRISARPWGEDAFLGETWMAWGDTPMGPWAWATQIVTHDQMSFYNPRQHPEFDEAGGRLVYFEGTYSQTFAGVPAGTPRYDYNQMMYRLDLEVVPTPVPVYGDGWTRTNVPPGAPDETPAFFALDRPAEGAVPLRWTGPDCAPRSLDQEGAGEIAFFVLADSERSPQVVPLWGHPVPGRGTGYGLIRPPGAEAVGWVWPSPTDVVIPVSDHPGPWSAQAGPDQCPAEGPIQLHGSSTDPQAALHWVWEGGEQEGADLTLDGEGVFVRTLVAVRPDGEEVRDTVVVEIGGERACDGCGHGGSGGLTAVGLLIVAGRRRCRGIRAG